MRRILFVDDEPEILRAMQRSLRRRRGEWEMVFANGARAALDELRSQAFDVVVSDGRMPDMDGIALLRQVKAEHPQTIRIILSGHADDEAIIPVLPTIHQFLSKPCESKVLESVLESALDTSRQSDTDAVREALLTADWLPPGPRLYNQLTRALKDPDLPMMRIYSLIERDASLTAVLLKTVNSAYFGMTRRVSTVAEAVRLVGVATIRCLTLFIEAFAHLDPTSRLGSGYIEWFHRHSFLTARIAEALAVGYPSADKAFTAGLLHDMGALLMATRLPADGAYMPTAIADAARLRVAEQQGITHAQLGGWLLAHWGLPAFLVEAASRHHGPLSGAERGTLDLTDIIHVADCLATELSPGPGCPSPAEIESLLINATSGKAQLDVWRQLAARVEKTI